ncbi:hypothetical protein [uncultured Sphingorhabdus sp.]|uniref:hypothetical protein n=1 Tax=uncultured Sphingorhabdus sp. TaxID=1686106 RepID=UPI00261005FF|nr:hypothetical protein [uncultured Sphingorhabdus sp.]HMS20022.1 hypothetical protein [Sphingorhabdus sp.]
MTSFTGIWFDESHLIDKTIGRLTGDGWTIYFDGNKVVEVTPNDTIVACATEVSSHGAPDLPLDPRKTAD